MFEEIRSKHFPAHDGLRLLNWEPAVMFPMINSSIGCRSKRGLLFFCAGILDSAVAGLVLGSSCFLICIFAGCNQTSKDNKRAVKGPIQHMRRMKSEWILMQNVTNEGFYLAGSELKELQLINYQVHSL